jgi:hypothetical protein
VRIPPPRYLRLGNDTMEAEYMEKPSWLVWFGDIDDEETDKNNESVIADECDGGDIPSLEWNKEDSQLTLVTVFLYMVDCCSALTTYCILSRNDFVIGKSEPTRFRVHCPHERCIGWREKRDAIASELKPTKPQVKFAKAEGYASFVIIWCLIVILLTSLELSKRNQRDASLLKCFLAVSLFALCVKLLS